jgi:4-diphosphocytidyl-2-C-methyl-D-erythritol kinase
VSESFSAVSVQVPAKINLHLSVEGLRPDGFHELSTVFHAVGLCDVVTAAPAPALSLQLVGDESAGLPADDGNLAWRAAALLAEQAERAATVALTVQKSIPIAAGLAGGSADAAGALLACDRLWGLNTPPEELARLAAQLGSDVTFALQGGTAIGTGRGEQLSALNPVHIFYWVIAAADTELSTPAVYAELDRLRASGQAPHPIGDAASVMSAVASGDPHQLAPLLGNDLQAAALSLAPQLSHTFDSAVAAGALAGLVSGSGPTCVFLAADERDARRLAQALTDSGTCRFAQVAVGNARTKVLG